MLIIQEKLQNKTGCFHSFTIDGHKLKNTPVYERGGKCIQSLFKEYQDELPEDEGAI